MNRKCCELLDDFLDGDLPAEEQEFFLETSQTCSDCQSAVQAKELLYSEVKTGWQNLAPPTSDLPEITPAKLLDSPADPTGQRLNISAYAAGIVLTLCVVIAGFWLIRDVGFQPGVGNEHNDDGQSRIAQEDIQDRNQNQKDVSAGAADSQRPIEHEALNKASIKLSDSQIGLRLDEPGDDFTFIQVYQKVN